MIDDAKLDELLAQALKIEREGKQRCAHTTALLVHTDTIRAIVQELKDWRASSAYLGPPVRVGFDLASEVDESACAVLCTECKAVTVAAADEPIRIRHQPGCSRKSEEVSP